MEGLGIDIKLLIAQIVNFLLFFFIFKKFAAKPFLDYFGNQKKQEEEKEKMLKELPEREIRAREQEKEIIKKAEEQGLVIIKEAKKTAVEIKGDSLKQGQKEIEAIKTRITKELEEERSNIYKEAKKKIMETCTAIIENVLSKFISEEKQTEVIEHLSKELGKGKSYGI